MMKIAHDPEEIIAVVDENDNIIDACARSKFTTDLIRRLVYVIIFNENNQILVQERADNKKLTASASGHFPHDETYLQGAKRETREELGLDLPLDAFKPLGKFYLEADSEFKRFTMLFAVKGNYKIEDFAFDPEEVESIQFYDLHVITKLIKENPSRFTSGFKKVIEMREDQF